MLLVLAGLSLIAAGVFEVDRPLAPQTIQEVVHSNAAVAAFVMLIVAMLLFSLACCGDDRWWSVRWVSMGLAVTAAGAAVATQLAARLGVLRRRAAGARRRRAGMVPVDGDPRPPPVVRRVVSSGRRGPGDAGIGEARMFERRLHALVAGLVLLGIAIVADGRRRRRSDRIGAAGASTTGGWRG